MKFKQLKFNVVYVILFILSLLYLGLMTIFGIIDKEATNQIAEIMLKSKNE